jgi:cbb3-type cytochrome oxidase subunit 3
MMDFLYFPENKMEYIPAVISLLCFMLLAYIVYRLFKRHSANEEAKMKAFEQDVMKRLESGELHNER